MTPRKTWLIVSAALAVAVYALMWIGYASNWNWLTTIDSFWLDVGHRYSVAHQGRVAAWNVFCTVLGPTAFRLMALIVIVFALLIFYWAIGLGLDADDALTEVAKDSQQIDYESPQRT